jgi:hypothetical protein
MSRLDVPRTRCTTVGTRVFLVVGVEGGNSLPWDITSAPILSVFANTLKHFYSIFLFLDPNFSFLSLVV